MSTRIHRLQQLRARLENGEALELSPDYRIDFARADVEYLLKLAEAWGKAMEIIATARDISRRMPPAEPEAEAYFAKQTLAMVENALTKYHQARREKP